MAFVAAGIFAHIMTQVGRSLLVGFGLGVASSWILH